VYLSQFSLVLAQQGSLLSELAAAFLLRQMQNPTIASAAYLKRHRRRVTDDRPRPPKRSPLGEGVGAGTALLQHIEDLDVHTGRQ
jgi:hypothetical protein